MESVCTRGEPSEENAYPLEHVNLLVDSYRCHTGRELLTTHLTGIDLARAVYSAPFALVSHGPEPNPIFNYGNRTALQLFAMNWTEFTAFESQYSAEQSNRGERARLLDEVQRNGYKDNYSGIRITRNGIRFMIKQATIWNVVDCNGRLHGQAATFSDWQYI